MHFYVRCVYHPQLAVVMKITLPDPTLFECYFAEHCRTKTVHNATFHHCHDDIRMNQLTWIDDTNHPID